MAEKYELITPPFRISYPHIIEPQEQTNDAGKTVLKYNCSCLFPSNTDLSKLEAVIQACAKAKFPNGEVPHAVVKKQLALRSGYPFNDQGEKAGKEQGYIDGALYFNASSKRPVGVVQGNPNFPDHNKAIAKEDLVDFVVPGYWFQAVVSFYANVPKKGVRMIPGVGVGLQALRFLKVDERFDGGVDAEGVDWSEEGVSDDFFSDDSPVAADDEETSALV